MELDILLNRFRLATRELFNHYFRIEDPYSRMDIAWALEERYREVESLLFEKLVLEPGDLHEMSYGTLHPHIRVELPHGEFAPFMLNRETDSGYWDHPLKEVTRDAKLAFISFFDWDQLAYRDHRYVRVQVMEWPSHPDAVGKHALIESIYVQFARG